MFVTFEEWTGGRSVSSWGTNAGTTQLPFQKWRHFKEAFAPELIARAVEQSLIPVTRCLDPFGGSGSTGLACQFLGIHPVIAEVNPFLADLIESKLDRFSADALAKDLGNILRAVNRSRGSDSVTLAHLPATFIEPGVNGRWIFDRQIATRIANLLKAFEVLEQEKHRRLFRVLLGGILIEVSNVVINGKGRRYRRGWKARHRDPAAVIDLFTQAAERAIGEIHKFGSRACMTSSVLRGDSRRLLNRSMKVDLVVFSPPCPNSFDYTDVYNVELWTLGYLRNSGDNQILRGSTLCSHVQLHRDFPTSPCGSTKLDRTLKRLVDRRASLWDHRIPEMVGGYFHDMIGILDRTWKVLADRGSVWMIVGDSRYAGVRIKTAEILVQLAERSGWSVDKIEACRSMRASAQQGGRRELAESLVVLTKRLP